MTANLNAFSIDHINLGKEGCQSVLRSLNADPKVFQTFADWTKNAQNSNFKTRELPRFAAQPELNQVFSLFDFKTKKLGNAVSLPYQNFFETTIGSQNDAQTIACLDGKVVFFSKWVTRDFRELRKIADTDFGRAARSWAVADATESADGNHDFLVRLYEPSVHKAVILANRAEGPFAAGYKYDSDSLLIYSTKTFFDLLERNSKINLSVFEANYVAR